MNIECLADQLAERILLPRLDLHRHGISRTLRGENFNASENVTGWGTPLVPAAFCGNQNDGGQMAVCYTILEPGVRNGVSTTCPRAGIGIGESSDPMFKLRVGRKHGIALSVHGRAGCATAGMIPWRGIQEYVPSVI